MNRYTSDIPEEEHKQSSCDAEQKDLQEGERVLLHNTLLLHILDHEDFITFTIKAMLYLYA